jgi:precorrin-2 dehydrogenase/sirohydrochlorin ferrochelatase
MLLLQELKSQITVERKELYPSFLKLHNLTHCGWWKCGIEKIVFVKIESNAIVGSRTSIFCQIRNGGNHPSVKLTYKSSIAGCKRHMVIACTDDLKVNKIYDLSRKDI